MLSNFYKAKQYIYFILKLTVVILAIYLIYHRLSTNLTFNGVSFYELIKQKITPFYIIILLIYSFINRFLEIIKWQNLVGFIKKISIYEATKQVMAALTSGILTPNNLGEYAGKALFFKKEKTKIIIFLNLVCNGIQMVLTVLFGVLALIYLKYYQLSLIVVLCLLALLFVVYFTKNITLKGFSLKKIGLKLNEIPNKIHQKNAILGLCRYLVFSHQYYFLFKIFNVSVPYFTLMAAIAAMYFLASSLPSFQFLDFAVKGSVGILLFSPLSINEWVVAFISMLMWLLNIAIPVLVGTYFVFQYKPKLQ